MTEKEYLLICLIEECAEVQHIASKCLRFGLDNYHPDHPEATNQQELNRELNDLDAVRYMLSEYATIFRSHIDPAIYAKKIMKVDKYMAVSEECGTLSKEEPPCSGQY